MKDNNFQDINSVSEDLKIDKNEVNSILKFTSNLFKIKNPDEMVDCASKEGLKKTLNAFDLIILGVGCIIGSGIFTVVGIAAAGGPESVGAGPALIISMILASIACIFSAMCYSEFASMIPVAGSAYLYTYATMGEFFAWLIGWALMLEYVVGYIAVASAWTGYFMQFLQGFSNYLPSFIINPPVWFIHDYGTASKLLIEQGLDPAINIPHIANIPISMNFPGVIITLVIVGFLIKGIKESTKMAGLMVVIKLGVIAAFLITGAFYIKPENWIGNSGNWWHTFAPNGMSGILMGAFIIFFAYIGFDAIATAAEETKEPQKNLPIGIIGSLGICTTVYVLVALVLTGICAIDKIDISAPVAHAIASVGNPVITGKIAGMISLGALTGLTSVLLVMMLAATRIIFAMSRDNFFPSSLKKLHKKYNTPHVITILVGIICIFGSTCLNLSTATELCNLGTFASFIIVCVAVLILRHKDPNRPRPYKVPFSPLFPLIGTICCTGLMLYSMKYLTTSRFLFPLWMFLGILFYFGYGYKNIRKNEER